MKDYEFIAFDAQYLLVRNFAALKGRTKSEELAFLTEEEGSTVEGHIITKYNFTEHDLVKQFFWSVVKLIRDDYSCNKVILLWDKAPYHKTSLLPDYKGTRVHISDESLDEIDIDKDPVGYLQMKEDLRIEKIKSKAKYWIIDYLNRFGMPSIIHDGYEADDLACIFSTAVKDRDMKSAICSADSDWSYWINDNVDFINFNNKESWTYNDMILELESKPTDLGISLFEMKMFIDSTFNSHNDLMKTSTLGWKDVIQLYDEIQDGDYSHITDKVRYENNMKSFEYWKYPEYDVVKLTVENSLHSGDLGNMETYFQLKSKGFSVSKSYTETYLTLLNPDYYEQSRKENSEEVRS